MNPTSKELGIKLQPRDFIKVSNSSILTMRIVNILNEKLTTQEKRDFLEWLKIIEREQLNELYKNKRNLHKHGI